jgi:hypothetical protein
MMTRLHKLFFYTFLLAVYGVFFSVESFFNFEGQTNARDVFRYVAMIRSHGPDLFNAGVPPLPASSHGIRLNKRYAPTDMPPCPVFPPTVPDHRLPVSPGIYRDPALPAITPLTYPLRGPPVAA